MVNQHCDGKQLIVFYTVACITIGVKGRARTGVERAGQSELWFVQPGRRSGRYSAIVIVIDSVVQS